MVRRPARDFRSASAMTSLISLMPLVTALKGMNSDLVRRAIKRARVVLPQPGGPQKSMEARVSDSIWTRRGLPGPRSFSWPMNSSRVRGRMRSARGCRAAEVSGSGRVGKRLIRNRVYLVLGEESNGGNRRRRRVGFDTEFTEKEHRVR